MPYNAPEINTPELSAVELFKKTYGQNLVSRRDEIRGKDLDVYLEKFLEGSEVSLQEAQSYEGEDGEGDRGDDRKQGVS